MIEANGALVGRFPMTSPGSGDYDGDDSDHEGGTPTVDPDQDGNSASRD